MTADSKASTSAERAHRELALIENIARHAILPTDARPPTTKEERPSKRKKTATVLETSSGVQKRNNDSKPTEHSDDRLTEFEREEKRFKAQISEMEKSIGTTVIPSSRDELIHAHENLRPSFDAIVELFRDRQGGMVPDNQSNIYDHLRKLMRAAFRIGAQATISTRAERFVQPRIAKDSTVRARATRETNKNAKRRAELDEAILRVSALSLEGKLVDSEEFAGRLLTGVHKLLEVEKEDDWPTQTTIRRHVATIIKNRRYRTAQTD